MAKSKKPKVTKKTVRGTNIIGETVTRRRPITMTSDEAKKLAKLLGSSGNIYALARNNFNIECAEDGDDEILFQKVTDHGGIFRCELCSVWKDVSETSHDIDVCEECYSGDNDDN